MTNKKILTLISLLLFLFLLVGCMLQPINHVPVITTTALPDATVGTAYTATVKATDADDDALTFSKVSGPTDMVISEAGVISGWTPTEVGTEAVTVAVTDGKDSVSADFTIKVNVAEVAELTGIEVVPETMSLFEGGDPETIDSVTATYSDGSTADIALKDCTYVSSATKVATVSDVGVVEAIAEGTATITVSYKEEGITKTVYIEETDTVAVTVSAVKLDHIVVLPEAMTLYKGGDLSASKTIESVTAYNNDGTKFEVDFVADCTYGLNPIGIVNITDDEVTADKVGKTTITITYEGKTDAIEVTVLAFELDHIVVVPETMTFDKEWKVDAYETIESVTAHYNDGTETDLELSDCEYESSDDKVATVDTGVVEAVAKGTATITVSYYEVEDVTAEAFVAVTVPNRAPEITTTALPEATVGTPYTATVEATDADEDTLAYYLPISPSGMEINSTSGQITWDPALEDSGETVTVRVSDGELSDTGEFTIAVRE